MAKTKLEQMTDEEIARMSKSDLRKATRAGLRAAYNRLDTLEKAGYPISDYNQTFKSVMGKDYGSALDDLGDSLNELRGKARYLQKHLKADSSSLQGMRRKERTGLELLAKLSGNEGATIKRVKGGYRMLGHTYSKEEMSEFWQIVRKVDEDHTMQTLKEGSGEGVSRVYEMVFNQGKKNPSEILQELKDVYKEQQLEQARKEEEQERRFEEIKKGRKYRND